MFFTGTFVNPYIFLASFCDDTAPALCSGLFLPVKKPRICAALNGCQIASGGTFPILILLIRQNHNT